MLLQAKLNSLYVFLLYGLAFLIPSGIYIFEGIIITLLLIVWIASKKYKGITWQSARPLYLLPLFFLLYILSLLYTDDLSNGVNQMTRHLPYILIPLFFITTVIDDKIKRNILLVFLFSTILFLLMADAYAVLDIIKTDSYIIRVGNGDYYKFLSYGLTRVFSDWHPTLVSLFLMMSLVITIQYLFKSEKKIAIPLIVFIILNIFLIKSLIGILCLFFMISIFLVASIKRNIYKVGLVFFLVLLASVFYFINPLRIDKIQQFKKTQIEITDKEEDRNVLSIRLVKWSSALNLYKQNPIMGVAPGDLKQNLVNQYMENGFEFAAANRFGPHNQFLQILAAFGLLGLLLFFVVIIYPLFLRLDPNNLYVWFLMITLMFFLTEDVLERQQGIVFFSFFYTLLVVQTKKP